MRCCWFIPISCTRKRWKAYWTRAALWWREATRDRKKNIRGNNVDFVRSLEFYISIITDKFTNSKI